MIEYSASVEDVLAAVRIVDLVPAVPGFPSSTFIRFASTGKELSLALSADVCGSAQIKTQGDALKKPLFCARSLLVPFLAVSASSKSKKPILFSVTNGRLKVRHNRRKGWFDCADSGAGYQSPEFDAKGAKTIQVSEAVAHALHLAASCASHDSSLPELDCAFMLTRKNRLFIYGANQFLASRSECKLPPGLPEHLAVPLFLIPHLVADGVKKACFYKNRVAVHFKSGVLWQTVSLKAQKDFPFQKYDKTINDLRSATKNLSLRAARLAAVATRFSSYLGSTKREDWLLNVSCAKGSREIVFQSSVVQGVFHEYLMLDKPSSFSFAFDWPLDLLIALFEDFSERQIEEVKISFNDNTPFLLTAGNTSVVIARRQKEK